MKPTWDTDCTYDAEAAAEFGSTITIEDSGIDKNKKHTVRITAQSIPHQVPSSRCGSPRVSMMSQAHGVKAAALPLQVHHRSRKRSSSAKLRHQDHFRQANSTITIEDAGIGMTESAAPELGKEASGIHDIIFSLS